jgi:hypothetical protein
MPSHMIGFISPEIGVPWHLGLHSSHHAATQTGKTMSSNFEFFANHICCTEFQPVMLKN